MRRIVAAGCACALGGCSVTKPIDDQVRTTAIERASEQSVEQTYRTIVAAMRRCYAKPAFGVEAAYFPDMKSGSLRLVLSKGTSLHELVRMQINSGPGGATVRAHYPTAETRFAQAVDAWVRGDATNCPLQDY